MRLHDAYARRTPVEMAFPDADAAASLFERIAEEAAHAGADPTDLQRFMELGAVVAALQDLRAPDVGGEAVHRYAALLQHAYLFDRTDAPVFLLGTAAARALVERAPSGTPELPAPAGYLQLPQHLFWVRGRDEPAESVDGLHWSLGTDGVLRILLAMGIRTDRAGLAVVPVAEAPWADAPDWMEVAIRAQGGDFETTLPGGEWDGLYSFEAAGEVLKLVARTFAYVGATGASDTQVHAAPTASPGSPPPSRYPFRRIDLAGHA